MSAAVKRRKPKMTSRHISISSKRQITIPQGFYEHLGFQNEAECFVRGNELIIRPAVTKSSGEFAEEILRDLIAKGLSGDELLSAFREEQAKVRPAVERILAEAQGLAASDEGECTFEDLFGRE